MAKNRIKPREMLFTSVITICIAIVIMRMYQHYTRQGVPVSPKQLDSILVPGHYNGFADYTPTKVYPNGLSCELIANVTKDQDTSNLEIRTRAFDKKTNKVTDKDIALSNKIEELSKKYKFY